MRAYQQSVRRCVAVAAADSTAWHGGHDTVSLLAPRRAPTGPSERRTLEDGTRRGVYDWPGPHAPDRVITTRSASCPRCCSSRGVSSSGRAGATPPRCPLHLAVARPRCPSSPAFASPCRRVLFVAADRALGPPPAHPLAFPRASPSTVHRACRSKQQGGRHRPLRARGCAASLRRARASATPPRFFFSVLRQSFLARKHWK